VDVWARAGTPAEREKARADAVPLRAKLQTLKSDVTALAAQVDQARRKASQAGVTVIR
jgi:outer membrane murein-binding lipoprotein Lpp